jgi:hypothetical protein
MALHPHQPDLPPQIEESWVTALEDAAVPVDQGLLYIFDGEQSQNGYGAHYFARGLLLQPDPDMPDVDHLLDDMNADACIDAYRIAIWTDRTTEGVAALLRHELEHGRQREAHGQRLFELYGVALGVLAERVGGLPGGGFLYQTIPVELDANAAAARFVRQRFGNDRIHELLTAGDKDGSAFRSLVGAPDIETLPERMIHFFATVPDLCELWAARQHFDFPTLIDLHWRGAGAVWERLSQDEGLRLPR